MSAFYNEIDAAAAASIREVMADGLIASGHVETRSIKDLTPHDLEGFTQAHFFAGAGAWSYAARLAGWPDGRQLWSGSCPCQPFSQAGKRAGFADERHLWPDFFGLIRACRPGVIVGEQVSGAAGYAWLDGVCADLEREGYAVEAFDIPAAAVDAPHIRQRLYWVAVAETDGGELGHADTQGKLQSQGGIANGGRWSGDTDARSFWSDAEWLQCHDGKARRAKPGVRMLAHGIPGRIHQWRIAGNSICIPLAVEFLKAVMETTP